MNATLKKKHEELEALRIRTRKILDEHKTMIPPEEMKALDAIKERADALRGEIEAETQLEQKRADLQDLERFLDDPVRKIPHGVEANDGGRKALSQAGWEIKSGIIYAPNSLEGTRYKGYDGEWKTVGKVAMYPDDVLFGDIPTDDEKAADFYRKTRAVFNPEYKTVYSKYLRNCVKYRSESMAFNMLDGREQKALSEGTDTAGGFIVPPDIQAEMLARLPQQAIMRQFARVQPTNRDTLKWPAVAPNAGTYNGISGGSILSSGFVGSWAGETPAFSDTDPSFESYDIAIKKIRCATKLSNDFVSDAAVNVLAWLAQNGAENMALVEDLGFIQGLGSALQPLGILNVPGILTTGVAGTTAHTISNTTSNTGSAPLLVTLAYSLPAQYTPRARWLMRRTVEGEIRGLVDANGRFLWPDFAQAGMTSGSPAALLGFPVTHSDWMPADGTSGNMPLILGDFSQYIIGQRTQITSVVLRERFADSDQVGIILFERVGGGAYNYDAFRIGTV